MEETRGAGRAETAFAFGRLNVGGAERAMITLANALVEAGHPIVVYVLIESGPMADHLDPRIELRVLGCRRTILSVRALRKALVADGVSTVVGVQTHVTIAALLATRRLPVDVIASEHIELEQYMAQQIAPVRLGTKLGVRLLYPRCTQIVAVSEGVADSVSSFGKLPRERICVIHNPVDAEAVRREAEGPLPDGIGHGEVDIISVGRLVRQKRYDVLLEAFARLDARRRLTIVGDGPERPALDELAGRLGVADRVRFAGEVPVPFPLMKSANVYVSSSDYEGLGVTIIEALALDLPIVCTDCPSGPSELLLGGRAGILVPVRDPAALAAGIEAAGGPDGRGPARAESLERFSIGPIAEAWAALL